MNVATKTIKKIKGKIIILSGPSGSGKTTIYNELLKDKRLTRAIEKTVSVTTRHQRPGEKEGVDYYFISLKMFQYKIRSGQLFEYQKVFDNYYGTLKKSVREILSKGKNVLLSIDVKGAEVVCGFHPEAVRIFIKTTTWAELKQRLKNRNTESKDVVALRLKTAKDELQKAKEYDYIVVNDQLNKAVKDVSEIVYQEIF